MYCFLRTPAIATAFLLVSCEEPEKPAAAADARKGACEQRRFKGSLFTVCRYDAAGHRIELILNDEEGPLRSFANLEQHLGERTAELAFAMNAGMYDKAGMPIGLYVEEGEQRRSLNLRSGPGNFHLKPNGVFAVDRKGLVSVTRSEDFKKGDALWATQSGPMLVIGGKLHPSFEQNGPSRLVRNGVGVAGPGTAFFAISDEGVSFGRFARLLRNELGCSDALFLDGTVSSLWDPATARQDAYPALGPMIAVFRKPTAKAPAPNP